MTVAELAQQDAEAASAPTPYQKMGGAAALRRVVERFYDIMATAPEAAAVRALHAEDLGPMRERLFEFLSGWLGGPALYFRRPDSKCMFSAHRAFPIGQQERDEWLTCMRQAMRDCAVPDEVKKMLGNYSAYISAPHLGRFPSFIVQAANRLALSSVL